MKGFFLIISGPSGSGKSTLIKRLLKNSDDFYFSISSTTRAPRDGEIDGKHYHFISKKEFEESIKKDEFLEWAYVHNDYYGTSLKEPTKAVDSGKIAILDIDVQGQKIAKSKLKERVSSIFLTTKNLKELEKRLTNRGSEESQKLKKRLENALIEIKEIKEYDYLVVNSDLEECYLELCAIVESLKFKTSNLDVDKFIKNWN